MSGIVRGWTPRAQMEDFTAHAVPMTVYADDLSDVAEAVAVVPLYDATLAAMAERMAKIDFESTVQGAEWGNTHDLLRKEIRAKQLVALRAAFGLDTAGA